LTVTWSVDGGVNYGTVDFNGVYTAPAVMPPFPFQAIVRATSVDDPAKSETALVSLLPAPNWGAFPISFDAYTQNGWKALQAPVTVGIPLRDGALSPASLGSLDVRDISSAVLDAQFKITSLWPSGDVRWLLVDFVANTVAGTSFTLNNSSGTPPNAITVSATDVGAAIDVDTGPLQFSIRKTDFRLFETIKIQRDGTGPYDECLNTAALSGVVATTGATQYTMTNSSTTAVIEESGPIRAVLKVEGTHDNGGTKLNYICRITAWAGTSMVKVQYSFKNMNGHGSTTTADAAAHAELNDIELVDALDLNLPFDFGSLPLAKVARNSGSHTHAFAATGDHVELYQSYAGTYDNNDPGNLPAAMTAGNQGGTALTDKWPAQDASQITYAVSGATTASGTHSNGWMQMASSGGTGAMRATVVVRDFWQLYPKTLRCEGNGLMQVGIWPDNANQLQMFAGSMKTHEFLVAMDNIGTADDTAGEIRANILNDPVIGILDPYHYRGSRVFGPIGVTDALMQDISGYNTTSANLISTYLDEIVAHQGDLLVDRNDGNGSAGGHEYGMWSYGEGKVEAPDNGFNNTRWNIAQACFQWHAASGSMPMLRLGEVAVRHFRDMDVMHADIGKHYVYTEAGNQAVTGGLATRIGGPRDGVNKQHAIGYYRDFGSPALSEFTGGFLGLHYLMTGDALSLDVLKEIFLYLQGTWKRHFDAANGGTDTTDTCNISHIASGLHIAALYEMANGMNDANAATMSNYVLNVLANRRSNVVAGIDPSGVGLPPSTGTFRVWEAGPLFEAWEQMRWVKDSTTTANGTDINIDATANWLLGSNLNAYGGWWGTPVPGAFGEIQGSTTDFGGANLMLGAAYAGALRENSAPGWPTRAENLVNTQNANIEAVLIGDSAIRHDSFVHFFRAGPTLLGVMMK
jgi:hypothetical protein